MTDLKKVRRAFASALKREPDSVQKAGRRLLCSLAAVALNPPHPRHKQAARDGLELFERVRRDHITL